MIFAVVLSGSSVSSAFECYPSDRRWAVFCPSMSGNSVRIDFATVSGGAGDVSFGALHAPADQPAVIASSTVRPAFGAFLPPTPWARIHLGAAATDQASFVLAPFQAR